MVEILEGGKRDNINTSAFVTTNFTEDYSFDANTVALADVADVLATLIRDLQRKGIVHGTTA